jgi:hypothetical protein
MLLHLSADRAAELMIPPWPPNPLFLPAMEKGAEWQGRDEAGRQAMTNSRLQLRRWHDPDLEFSVLVSCLGAMSPSSQQRIRIIKLPSHSREDQTELNGEVRPAY